MVIKLFLIGDSNVDRHFAKVKSARNDPCFENVTVVKATNLAQVKGAVSPAELAEARSHVLLACLTNPIASFPFTDISSLLKHCDSVFAQVKSYIAEGRAAVPGDLEQVLHKSILTPILILLYKFLAVILETFYFYSQVYLMPPMYRECPFWYKRNFAQITASFTSAFRQPIGHTFTLASYTNPAFELDGIHLTEDDGIR